MKKLVLLSLVTLLTTFVWAADPSKSAQKPLASMPGTKTIQANHSRTTPLRSGQRSGGLQKVLIGKAGNLLSVLNANCHQIDVDSALNTVVFIHRSDTVTGYAAANVAQYRYDVSRDGGANWNVNIGPLNPLADNITINGRYPQAVLRPDPTALTTTDSSYLVYNGSWHNGGTANVWQGQYYGAGQLTGNIANFTEHNEIVNNANVEIATSMIQSQPGHFWNINLNYTLNGTVDTIRGIILERGLWNDSAREVLWTYQNINIGSELVFSAAGAVTGNNLGNPTISFDPTGQYGWILLNGDITADGNFTNRPILMHSTDFGATWSAPYQLVLDGLPGMFTPPASINTSAGAITTTGTTLVGSIQITVDSAGNPHIAAIVGVTDSTSNQYAFYPSVGMVLYDLYYNPSVSGCSWQANFLSYIHGYSANYTSDNTSEGNRVQMSRSKDGKKIFIFWNDTDSSVVAGITDVNNTNPNPNLYGIGIDMGIRKITNVVNFTSGDPLFGGQIPSQSLANGTLSGSLFPIISPNSLDQGAGAYNIPAVLTEPDYKAPPATKVSTNAARFYYCQNINFTQSQYVSSFDNAPPTLTVFGPDTVFVQLGHPYNPPADTATDCVYGIIHPQFHSNVPTDVNRNTDSAGVFRSTWTATNPAGNYSTFTQVVIVSGPPIARIYYVALTGQYRFAFTDTSLNFPTNRTWYWGDGTSNNLNQPHATKVYTTAGQKCVVLKAWNQYGTSYDTVCLQVHLTGINDIELSDKISVYPNPSTGTVNIELSEDIANGAKVSVYNILGAQVNETIEVKSNITKTALNLNNLESGVYMLKVETPNGTAVKQIVINK
jgi:hypothetical protein